MTLREKTLTAVKWNLLSTLITTSLGVILLWALSHLLGTQQYGVISAALVISTFCSVVLDFGISNSIVRSQSVEKIELSSLYVINVALGVLVCVLVMGFSAQISALFKAGEMLTSQIRIMALGFVILSFGLQPRALLTREMKFNRIAQITLATTITNFIVALTLAFIYHSAWCIAVAFLLSSVVNVLASGIAARSLLNYQFRFRLSAVKKHFHYGLQLVMDSLINQTSINTYPVLMSRLISISAIGGYNIAYSISIALFEKLNPVLSHALFPAFARISHDESRLKASFLQVTTFSALVNFPLLMGMLLVAEPLVSVFFDAKWAFITPIIQVLCVTGAIRSLDTAVISVLLVKAKMHLNVRLGLVKLLTGMPLAYVMGQKFALPGIVYSFLIMQLFNTLCGGLWLLRACLGEIAGAYARAVALPVLHVLPMLVVCVLLKQQTTALADYQQLALIIITGVAVYAATIFLSPCQTVRMFRQIAVNTVMMKRVAI